MRGKKDKESKPEESADVLERLRTGAERTAPVSSPLGKEHLAALNQVIKECTETECMCKACADAGIDVEPEAQVNREQKLMAEKLKATFFPHAS